MLDPKTATPLYVQMIDILERQIVFGELEAGERLVALNNHRLLVGKPQAAHVDSLTAGGLPQTAGQLCIEYHQAGERLPSESELAKQFGVSIITVRNAVGELCKRGLLERKQGKGTFVRKTVDLKEFLFLYTKITKIHEKSKLDLRDRRLIFDL